MLRKTVLIMMLALLVCSTGVAGAEPSPFAQGFIEGYLLDISARSEAGMTAEIETYGGERFNLTIHPQARFLIDNRPVKSGELRAGMEVYGTIQGRQLLTLEAYSTANLGFINPGTKVRKGIITSLSSNSLQVRSGNGAKISYQLSPATIVLKKGRVVSADTLYTGDRVKLFFDDINTDRISRLEIQGESILIKDLYRGQIAAIDEFSNRLAMQNLERFYNGSWQELKPSIQLSYSRDLPIYYGGQVINQRNWKYYQGKTAYLISKNLLGRETIDQAVIKGQYESGFADKIESVNWFTDTFELASHRNLTLNPGTIIIKNGRVQDSYAINPRDDAYIVADGSGISRTANIVYIYNEDLNPSSLGQHYLYCGRLDQIFEDRIWLDDYSTLNQHEWEYYSHDKELFYDLDSVLYDLEAQRKLSAAELYAGDYAVDEDGDRARELKLEDWYAWVYTDGDRIASMAVQKELDIDAGGRVTAGRVISLADDNLVGWTVVLGDSRDWSSRREAWVPKNADLRVNLDRAMIIREGKIIAAADLKTGDRLYIIRDDFRAQVVIVQ